MRIKKPTKIESDLDLLEDAIARIQALEEGQLLKSDFTNSKCTKYLQTKGRGNLEWNALVVLVFV